MDEDKPIEHMLENKDGLEEGDKVKLFLSEERSMIVTVKDLEPEEGEVQFYDNTTEKNYWLDESEGEVYIKWEREDYEGEPFIKWKSVE